jgi:NADPH-dependent 2,4-dienoyl-CoA reductase/sulfur reductase-like enzyme/peroxiredoxin family protein/rhodanese-related sulfurtransferase/TusA-related sulfurtransferase
MNRTGGGEMAKKVLIIGGVAGGASAAARLRRLDEEAEIVMIEKGQYVSFANCGLPYHIGEVIKDRESLIVQTPEKLRAKFNIDVRINSEAVKINRQDKTVEVTDRAHGRTYTEPYDKLLISTGADPIRPDIPGIGSDRIFTLRNIPDTLRIKNCVDTMSPKRALLVGAGFIGLEVAENLYRRGLDVTIVELADHVIGPLDFEMAAIVHQHLKSKKVELYLKDAVISFEDEDGHLLAKLKSGREIKTDMVILGVGVKPDSMLAKQAGLETGPRGGIIVDEYLRTSDKDIYAVGDAIEVTDLVSGSKTQIPLAGPANRQGRTAAGNIAGREEKYPGTLGTSIVKIFDITVAATGSSEATLKRLGISCEKSFTHSGSHAGYYPGALPMSIKLIFSPEDGRILGAQIVGYDGVDKRIDVIAASIYGKMTVFDLEKLELAYAPPYSSAKDPVNIAGYVASNIIRGDLKIFHWDEVKNIDTEKDMLLDVRPAEEYALNHLNGAVNIPVTEIRNRLDEIPKDKNVYIYCNIGLNAYFAYRILFLNGYTKIKDLSGSLKTYELAAAVQSNEDIFEYDRILKNDDFAKIGGNNANIAADAHLEIDACGLQCPGPILKVYENIAKIEYGQILHITASDPGFEKDVRAWCESTGNILTGFRFEDKKFHAYIRRQMSVKKETHVRDKNDKTIVILSGELDKAIAAFIIANGAAAMGRKVTMFFTFWGLNILRKNERVKVKKDLLSRMFSFMMPRGSKRAKLSKLSMFGIGGKLIRYLMKKNNIDTLEGLIASAMKNGVSVVACTMTMDLMGIKKEELMDGIEYGGVASMLGAAEDSDASLFIS